MVTETKAQKQEPQLHITDLQITLLRQQGAGLVGPIDTSIHGQQQVLQGLHQQT